MSDRCHYINVPGVGRVLIPGCMAVAVSGDIELCTCQKRKREIDPTKEVERLRKENKELRKEIKRLKSLLY
nr:MAG TPA: valyl-tRNA synthetase [Caudoviricetes sp.]